MPELVGHSAAKNGLQIVPWKSNENGNLRGVGISLPFGKGDEKERDEICRGVRGRGRGVGIVGWG